MFDGVIVQREDPGTARRRCRFDSGWLHHARLDQRRDRRADIPETAGLIPAVRTITIMGTSSNGKMPLSHSGDEGSIPSVSTAPPPLHGGALARYARGFGFDSRRRLHEHHAPARGRDPGLRTRERRFESFQGYRATAHGCDPGLRSPMRRFDSARWYALEVLSEGTPVS